MKLYRFDRALGGGTHPEGANLPGGLVWEPAGVLRAMPVRDDILDVVRDFGFFVWARVGEWASDA